MSVKLNRRQKAFADNYIKTGNAYQSALQAGYSESYAKTDSHRLLENPKIKGYILERTGKILEKQEEKMIAEQEDVLRALSKIVLDGYDKDFSKRKVKRYQEDENGNVMQVEEEYRRPNPTEVIRASEKLAELLGMTLDGIERGSTNVTIINDVSKEEE